MGLLDVLFGVASILDAVSDDSEKFEIVCTSLELFEIGTTWQGTARVHGAGRHIRTEKKHIKDSISMPKEDTHNHTRRYILRENLLKWAIDTLATGKTVSKDHIVLNPSEECLSFEGFMKQEGNSYKMTTNVSEADYYGAYKLTVYKDGKMLSHEDLHYYFKADTVARISSVNVTKGF